jgi:hypothetical protein
MFSHPKSSHRADPGNRQVPTLSGAVALVAIAGLALGACTAPAAAKSNDGAAAPVLIGEHSALGQRLIDSRNEALASVAYPLGEHAGISKADYESQTSVAYPLGEHAGISKADYEAESR